MLKGTFPGAEEKSILVHDTEYIQQMPKLTLSQFAKEIKQAGHWLADDRLLSGDGRQPFNIDLLIGADVMWTIASTTFLCSGDGYKAQRIIFGWAIQGSRTMHGIKNENTTALAAMLTCCTTKKAVKAVVFSPEEKQRRGHSSKGNCLQTAVPSVAAVPKKNLRAAMAAVATVHTEEIDQRAAATTQLGTVLEPSE